ncbi:hypothetical protein DYQ05_11740 [Treponema pedis]|nr:hypothetical protein DYQ05_11740 [Treponema pedis]
MIYEHLFSFFLIQIIIYQFMFCHNIFLLLNIYVLNKIIFFSSGALHIGLNTLIIFYGSILSLVLSFKNLTKPFIIFSPIIFKFISIST